MIVVAAGPVGCDERSVENAGGASTPDASMHSAPAVHRASPSACDRTAPVAGDAKDYATGSCSSDVDCDGGVNGRCTFGGTVATSTGSASANVCTYDRCFADQDCGDGGVCSCRPASAGANTCWAADCRLDDDCPESHYCSPSGRRANTSGMAGRLAVPAKPSFIAVGYYCHRAADQCWADRDCNPNPSNQLPPFTHCAFHSDLKHWVCTEFAGGN